MASSKNEEPHPLLKQNKPWDINDNNIWLASTVGLRRNIEKFNFPGKLTAERRKQIVNLISKELLSRPDLQKPVLIQGEEIGPLEKEFLLEHFLTFENYNQASNGEAFIFDETGSFLATINFDDHLHLQMLDCKGEIENTWNKLVQIETAIGNQVAYSFSHKFGFLTSDFDHCGTALTVSAFLQLPALIHSEKIDEILEETVDENLTIMGIQGNPTEIVGDVIVVQNNYTLGITEETIVSSIRSFSTKMMVEENTARKKIKEPDDSNVKDKVSRAFGILIHSYQIEAIEALNAISLLKLGVEMGWVKGVSVLDLNKLFFNSRRSHLLCNFPQKISQEEIIHKRAEFIHKTLKNAQLTI